MDIHLTKESRKVLKAIYDIYRDRRKSGMSKSASTYFDSQADGGPEICGIDDAKQELSRVGFICYDVLGGFELKDEAIIFMENFSKDSILKWLEFGANFIP